LFILRLIITRKERNRLTNAAGKAKETERKQTLMRGEREKKNDRNNNNNKKKTVQYPTAKKK
jgi:hypothetical protein